MKKRHAARSDFDSPWKEALEHFLPSFLQFFFPHIHADIDWSQGYESLDKELHQIVRDAKSRKALADKLFKVWLCTGEETWLLIHIEVQGDPAEDFPLRMFQYNVRAFERYNRTVVSLAVLTDNDASWLPERFEYGRWGGVTGIRFLVKKLLAYEGHEAELEADANPFARVVAAHLRARQTRKDPESRLRYKVQLVKGLFQQGWSAGEIRQLFRVIDWMLHLPEELQKAFGEDLQQWEESMGIPYITSIERMGIQRGLEEGMHKGLCKGISSVLKIKFGAAGKRLMPRVRKIEAIGQLETFLDALGSLQTIQEVREYLARLSG